MEKQIDKLIDYIIKCDIEIPKIIISLSNLLPDKEISESIKNILEKGE